MKENYENLLQPQESELFAESMNAIASEPDHGQWREHLSAMKMIAEKIRLYLEIQDLLELNKTELTPTQAQRLESGLYILQTEPIDLSRLQNIEEVVLSTKNELAKVGRDSILTTDAFLQVLHADKQLPVDRLYALIDAFATHHIRLLNAKDTHDIDAVLNILKTDSSAPHSDRSLENIRAQALSYLRPTLRRMLSVEHEIATLPGQLPRQLPPDHDSLNLFQKIGERLQGFLTGYQNERERLAQTLDQCSDLYFPYWKRQELAALDEGISALRGDVAEGERSPAWKPALLKEIITSQLEKHATKNEG